MNDNFKRLSEADYLSTKRQASHSYRLRFFANAEGIAKEMEFSSPNLVQAIWFALDDPKHRNVELWEDGLFACTISRDPIDVRFDEEPGHITDPPAQQ